MPVPITVRCPCGVQTEANAGDVVTCACGRRYDTSAMAADQVAAATLAQRRAKVYARPRWQRQVKADLASMPNSRIEAEQ